MKEPAYEICAAGLVLHPDYYASKINNHDKEQMQTCEHKDSEIKL